jgi:predicted chitinase
MTIATEDFPTVIADLERMLRVMRYPCNLASQKEAKARIVDFVGQVRQKGVWDLWESSKSIPSMTYKAALLKAVPPSYQEAARAAFPVILEALHAMSVTSADHIAYVLATIEHESGFKPVVEQRAKSGTDLFNRQERYWPTGFYGRGFIQLTWINNYVRMGEKLNLPLKMQPNLALEPEVAARIAALGMRDGLFTGKKLSDFSHPDAYDFHNARTIINGLDCADKIALIAKRYRAVI